VSEDLRKVRKRRAIPHARKGRSRRCRLLSRDREKNQCESGGDPRRIADEENDPLHLAPDGTFIVRVESRKKKRALYDGRRNCRLRTSGVITTWAASTSSAQESRRKTVPFDQESVLEGI
jgi:hypothetical protein